MQEHERNNLSPKKRKFLNTYNDTGSIKNKKMQMYPIILDHSINVLLKNGNSQHPKLESLPFRPSIQHVCLPSFLPSSLSLKYFERPDHENDPHGPLIQPMENGGQKALNSR